MYREIKNITVLMPAYNCGKYISFAIKSILNQTFRDFEFLIIDDGSDDNTGEIIADFKDSRIIYKKIEHSGTAKALNYGVNIARTEWIARIDADDLNVNNRLEKQIEYLKYNPEIDIISSWSVYFNDSKKILYLLKPPSEHEDIVKFLNVHNPVNQSSVIYPKKLLIENKFSETYENNEDFEFLFRIRKSVKFHILPEFLCYTRVRKESKTARMDKNMFSLLFREANNNFEISENPEDIKYWKKVIASVNFFYGDMKNLRIYLRKFTHPKETLIYLVTFLPYEYAQKIAYSRIKYKLQSLFYRKSIFYKELNSLLS